MDANYYELLQQTTNLDNINPLVRTNSIDDIPPNAKGQVRSVLTELRNNWIKALFQLELENIDISEACVLDKKTWKQLINQHKSLFI